MNWRLKDVEIFGEPGEPLQEWTSALRCADKWMEAPKFITIQLPPIHLYVECVDFLILFV